MRPIDKLFGKREKKRKKKDLLIRLDEYTKVYTRRIKVYDYLYDNETCKWNFA